MIKMEKRRLPIIFNISDLLIPYYPNLKKKLIAAESKETIEEYMDKTLVISILFSIIFSGFLSLFLWIFFIVIDPVSIFLVFFVLFIVNSFMFFLLFVRNVDVKLLKMKREIDYDLIFAIKHLIILLNAGLPLFDAMTNLTQGYGRISKEFKKIVERVSLGEPLTLVLRDVAEKTPSNSFKRVLIQITNAVVSGSDISTSLSSVLNQITKEQLLEIKEYGQKLMPLVMFYLIIGIIMPALSVVFLMLFLSFSSNISLPFLYLLGIAVAIGLIQFLFLAFIDSTRPRYAIID